MIDVLFMADLIAVTLRGSPFPDLYRAVPLLLGTAAQESNLTYTLQLGGGVARGYWQCEPATETDCWLNYLAYRPELREWFLTHCGVTGPNVEALEHNMCYGILMARTHYFRCDPERLPPADDLEAQSENWKTYYNTNLGKGTTADYIASYNALIKPYWPSRGTV